MSLQPENARNIELTYCDLAMPNIHFVEAFMYQLIMA